MSRTKKGSKGTGAEYWTKRPFSGTPISHNAGVNKKTKRLTHKIERRRNKVKDLNE